jgi:hypothetical protein
MMTTCARHGPTVKGERNAANKKGAAGEHCAPIIESANYLR